MEGNPEQVRLEGVKPTGWDASKSQEVFGGGLALYGF